MLNQVIINQAIIKTKVLENISQEIILELQVLIHLLIIGLNLIEQDQNLSQIIVTLNQIIVQIQTQTQIIQFEKVLDLKNLFEHLNLVQK